MGSRAQIGIRHGRYGDGDWVFLYTHWGAETAVQTAYKALTRGESRINDPEYFTRIVLDELKGDDRELTGFGVGLDLHFDIQTLVLIDGEDELVNVYGLENKYQNDEDVICKKLHEKARLHLQFAGNIKQFKLENKGG